MNHDEATVEALRQARVAAHAILADNPGAGLAVTGHLIVRTAAASATKSIVDRAMARRPPPRVSPDHLRKMVSATIADAIAEQLR